MGRAGFCSYTTHSPTGLNCVTFVGSQQHQEQQQPWMESRELPKEMMGIGIFEGDLCGYVEEGKAGERRARDKDGGMESEHHPWKNGWFSL